MLRHYRVKFWCDVFLKSSSSCRSLTNGIIINWCGCLIPVHHILKITAFFSKPIFVFVLATETIKYLSKKKKKTWNKKIWVETSCVVSSNRSFLVSSYIFKLRPKKFNSENYGDPIQLLISLPSRSKLDAIHGFFWCGVKQFVWPYFQSRIHFFMYVSEGVQFPSCNFSLKHKRGIVGSWI